MQPSSAALAQQRDGIHGTVRVACRASKPGALPHDTTGHAWLAPSASAAMAADASDGAIHCGGGALRRCPLLTHAFRSKRYVLASSAPSCRVYIDCTPRTTAMRWQPRTTRSAKSISSPSETLANV